MYLCGSRDEVLDGGHVPCCPAHLPCHGAQKYLSYPSPAKPI